MDDMRSISTLTQEAGQAADQALALLREDGYEKKRVSEKEVAVMATILNEAIDGSARAQYLLKEAMVTADFPYLMADILDRGIFAHWADTKPAWENYTEVGTLRDFRQAKWMGMEGMQSVLDQVLERGEYKERGPVEMTPVYRQLYKFGARFGLSWESIVNDDLGMLRDLPQRLVEAARRTEALQVSKLYVGTAGFNTSLFSDTYDNIVNTHAGASSNNPALSLAALAQAFLVMGGHKDYDGFPITIEAVTLVVPPALEVTANNILNATEINVATGGGAYNAADQLRVANWMRGRLTVEVDPYISLTATSNASTTWFLFASKNSARPALHADRLAGHESPELFIKVPNASRVGGGTVAESFETDEQEWKVRHCFGSLTVAPFACVASNGSGS